MNQSTEKGSEGTATALVYSGGPASWSQDARTGDWSQDGEYLLKHQYKDASNLNARISLHQRFSTNPLPLFRWVFDQFNIAPDSRILELGCGTGELWLANSDRIPREWEVTLSDFSAGMLQEAQRNLQSCTSVFTYAVVDAESIPFADATFDCVIANFMLYHVPDREKALAEIHRVVKPEGHFYAATIGAQHLHQIGELIRRVRDTYDWNAKPEDSFFLENGANEIAQWFSRVETHRMDDSLAITEAEPLLRYILSGRAKSVLAEDEVSQLRTLIEQLFIEQGSIVITKDSGLFEAYGRK